MIKDMNKKIIYIVVAGAVVALSSVWLYAQQKPPIGWTPKEVVEIVLPNATINVPVSLNSNKNLNNVVLSLVPSLQSIVSVQPKSFQQLSSGGSYPVILTVKTSQTSQLKYSGTLHVKDQLGANTFATPLSITVVVHNQPVPPDPGEAGKANLEGIDLDNDGVRDDIQRWIILNYLNSEKTQLALRQYAKALQPFLRDAEDKQLSRVHTEETHAAYACMNYVLGFDEYDKASDELRAQFLNTDLRSKTYIKADSQLSGMSGTLGPQSQYKFQCSFNPDSQEN